MSDTVLYEIKDRIAYITLNRPDQLNAQNSEMRKRLREVYDDFDRNPDCSAGIVTGAGDRSFSTGADLKERTARDAQGNRDPLPENDLETAKPMIVAIHGWCIAAGLELAMRADIRIATPESRFGLPEPRWSLLAGYGLHNLNRMVPLGEALHMQLTGDFIDAERAYQIGLIQRLAPRDQLMDEARKVADSILSCAPRAVQAIKDIVKTGRNMPIESAWKYGHPIAREVYSTEDATEGPKAFVEKRRPQWKSR